MENTETNVVAPQDELAALKARADLLGIAYHPSIGLEKLRAKVNAAVAGDPSEDDNDTDLAPVAKETESQRRTRLSNEASALIRVRVTCMNPNKREWEGEIFSVGNAAVGTHKKFIPFNTPDGWHIPKIIYDQLIARECQIFVTKKDARGRSVRVGKLIKEFAVEVLPPLTQEELDELARRQAMAGSVE